jgi:DeoR-like helix-turn-helix domain
MTDAELDALLTVVEFQRGTRGPLSWTKRSREGMSLIRGHGRVQVAHFLGAGGLPKTFQGKSSVHQIATKHWHALPSASSGERSHGYANVVQALMLLASPTYGTTVAEKCQTVAAIALQVYPVRDEGDYDAEQDTAAIIAKIVHGDPYTNHPGHFLVPYWALEYRPPIPRSPRAGRPPGSWKSRVAALRRLLVRNAEGARVEHLTTRRGAIKLTVKLTVAAIARQLGVSVSTARRDLAQLEAQHEIIRDEASGRTGQLIVVLQPFFGHVADGSRPGRR